MARRRRPVAQHENHERWLISYADFITLLFAFFVVMFASSQTDKAKAQMVSDSVKTALEGGIPAITHEVLGGTVDEKGKGNAMMKGPGGSNPIIQPVLQQPPQVAELAPSMHYLTEALRTEIKEGKVELHMEPRGLVVSLHQNTFFPSGETEVSPATFDSVRKIAEVIGKLPNAIRLEGHTDSVPIHTTRFRSNWELSAARSIAMLELLSTRYGISPERLAIAGYADTAPQDSNDTEEGRAHNRRVDVVILNQEVLVGPAGTLPPSASQSPVATPKK